MGRVILGLDEDTFWNLTPRILYNLIDLHREINIKPAGKDSISYIDQIL